MGGDNLFVELDSGDLSQLGMDPTALFADPRFTTQWFFCTAQ